MNPEIFPPCDAMHDEDCDVLDDTYFIVAQIHSMFVEPTYLTQFL